jgi:hypothetical protein
MGHDDAHSTGLDVSDSDLVPRPVFWLWTAVVFILLVLAVIVVSDMVARSLWHRRVPEGFGAAIGMVATVLAPWLVDRALRLFGASRSGRTVERRGRVRLTPAEDDTAGVVELFYRRRDLIAHGILAFLVLLLAGIGLVALGLHDHDAVWRVAGFVLGPLFILGGIWAGVDCARELWRGQPYLRIDPDGVTGVPASQKTSLRRTFVPWSRIATCEVETVRDTWGRVTTSMAIFQDAEGRPLLTTPLTWPWAASAYEAEHSQALKAIRARLPKPADVAWEREVV